MGVALTNPNDRRRINMLTRIAQKADADPSELVSQWLASAAKYKTDKGGMAKAHDELLAKYGLPARAAKGERGKGFAEQFGPNGAITKYQRNTSKEEKRARTRGRAKLRREIALEFESQGGKGYKDQKRVIRFENGKPVFGAVAYHKRALGSKADRYLLKAKRSAGPTYTSNLPENAARKGKAFSTGLRNAPTYNILNVDGEKGVRAWNAKRVEARAKGISHQARWAAQQQGRPATQGQRSIDRPSTRRCSLARPPTGRRAAPRRR